MAAIQFNVEVDFDVPALLVWDELVDWKGHEAWIPATRVEIDRAGTGVGATFTAWTGVGKLALEDRMRVVACDWSTATESGFCRVDKLGPVLRGHAEFTVSSARDGARVDWVEDVTMARLPQMFAPIAALIGKVGFRLGMWRLNRLLVKRARTATA